LTQISDSEREDYSWSSADIKGYQMVKVSVGVLEAAQIIGIGPSKVRQEISAGNLPAKKLGGRVILTVQDIQNYVDKLPAA
jgi:hypothetical protein